GEHRVDRWALRRRPADVALTHAGAPEGGAGRATGGRTVRARPDLRAGGAGQLPGCAGEGAAPAGDVERPGRLRPAGPRAGRALPRRVQEVRLTVPGASGER